MGKVSTDAGVDCFDERFRSPDYSVIGRFDAPALSRARLGARLCSALSRPKPFATIGAFLPKIESS